MKSLTGHSQTINIKRLKMKQILIILSGFIVLISCNKENENVPDYQPGRLTEVSHEAFSLGLVYHKYEYSGEDVTDLYYYSSPKVYISKFHFENKQLKEIHYSIENSNKEYFYTDSISYSYSDTLVIETKYFEDESHEEFYLMKNGKIISSTWQDGSNKFLDYYYEWSGDNLIRIVKEFWFGSPLTANITEYVFEYSDIENPFYFSNIPRIMKEFNNPYNNFDELTDLIPECSMNFPLTLTIIEDGPLWDGPTIFQKYMFDCKTFPYMNKPYEVKMINKNNVSVDYSLTYEKQ